MGQQRTDAASEPDIVACEKAIGHSLPERIQAQLLVRNGQTINDSRGATGEEWRFLPVLDRTDRRSLIATAEDIAWHTAKLRAQGSEFADVVVIARAWAEDCRLVMRVGDDQVYRQRAAGGLTPIDADKLGVRPKPKRGSRARARKDIPAFRYHPDPVKTGSIVEDAQAVCPMCEESRGWAYSTSPYAIGNHPDLCPWCIADGTAAKSFGASFIDVYWFDDADKPASDQALDELAHRTPGFASFQQEEWQYCHNEPCAFYGRASAATLAALLSEQRNEYPIDDAYVEALREAEQNNEDLYAVAWEFRCLTCGAVHLWMDVA